MMFRRATLLAVILWVALAHAAPPQRIISLSPNLTEILYGIGAFNRVVAVSSYCSYPPSARSLPKVGGWMSPNLERIVSLSPDLLVIADAQSTVMGYQLRQLGVPILAVPSQTMADVFSSIKSLGDATGHQREAEALTAQTRAALEKVRQRTGKLARPSVLVAIDRSPGSLRDLYVVTQGSFLAELVEAAGGRVTVPRARAGYSTISKEALLILNPDIIVELKPGARPGELEKARAEWNEMPELDAVKKHKVYALGEDFIPHNSQLVAQTVALLGHIFHPEVPSRELGAQ